MIEMGKGVCGGGWGGVKYYSCWARSCPVVCACVCVALENF